MAWVLAARGADRPAGAAASEARGPRHALPDAIPGAEPPAGAEDRAPSPYVAAHAAVAEALGYVAVRCWVGTDWDVDLEDRYQSRISNGWYTSVKTTLSGLENVVMPWDEANPGRETLFVVSWAATEPGAVVPCEVRTPEYAEIRVRVADAEGAPLAATVFGCGSQGQSDDRGLATLEQVDAGRPCKVAAQRLDEGGVACSGDVTTGPLARGEVRSVELAMVCLDLSDGAVLEALATSEGTAPPVRREPPAMRRLSYAEELERLRGLEDRELGEAGDEVVDWLIAHRERMVPIQAARDAEDEAFDQRSLEIRAMFLAAQEAATPEEAEALREEAIRRKEAELYILMEHFDLAQ